MTDKFLISFWESAPPPWNILGPKLAEKIVEGNMNPNPVTDLIRQRYSWARQFRAERTKLGLSQIQVAGEFGIKPYQIARVETADPGGQYKKIAQLYGIKLEGLGE